MNQSLPATQWEQMPPTLTVFCKINIWKGLKCCLAQARDEIQQTAHTVPAPWSLLRHCEQSVTWEKKLTQGTVTLQRCTWNSHMHVNTTCSAHHGTRISEIELNVCAHKYTKELLRKAGFILFILLSLCVQPPPEATSVNILPLTSKPSGTHTTTPRLNS